MLVEFLMTLVLVDCDYFVFVWHVLLTECWLRPYDSKQTNMIREVR